MVKLVPTVFLGDGDKGPRSTEKISTPYNTHSESDSTEDQELSF